MKCDLVSDEVPHGRIAERRDKARLEPHTEIPVARYGGNIRAREYGAGEDSDWPFRVKVKQHIETSVRNGREIPVGIIDIFVEVRDAVAADYPLEIVSAGQRKIWLDRFHKGHLRNVKMRAR